MATFYLNHEAELYHYGVKGMKWGNHKYAEDYATGPSKYKPKSKMTVWESRKRLKEHAEDMADYHKYQEGQAAKMKKDEDKAKKEKAKKAKWESDLKARREAEKEAKDKAGKEAAWKKHLNEKAEAERRDNIHNKATSERARGQAEYDAKQKRDELRRRANENVYSQRQRAQAAQERALRESKRKSNSRQGLEERASKNAKIQHNRERYGREKALYEEEKRRRRRKKFEEATGTSVPGHAAMQFRRSR